MYRTLFAAAPLAMLTLTDPMVITKIEGRQWNAHVQVDDHPVR